MLRNSSETKKSRIQLARAGLAAGLIAVACAIVFFAMVHNEPFPYHPAIDGWNDILLHMGAFGALTFFALMIWRRSLRLTVALVAFGVLIELIQIAFPARQADVMDVAANGLGIAFGYAMFAAMRWLSCDKIDSLAGMRK